MYEILKAIHFLSFSIGIGGGVANALLGAKLAQAEPETAVKFAPVARLVGRLSFLGLILLWLTGGAMLSLAYDGWTGLPVMFWIKIGCVVVLTVAATLAQLMVLGAQVRKRPPNPARMAKLGMVITGSAVLAVVFAVLAFR
ncbi:MAG: hypothetical protein GY952_03040 [Rhodobacteraceae bacterium]|nr:hypothetical protein [Paracoccaceae bacterium]